VGLKKGIYRSEIKKDILTQMSLEQVDLIFNQQHGNYTMNNKYNIAQVMVEITEHFLYGICNEKGLELIKAYKQKISQPL
jgi:hypothetical protein